MANDLTFSMDVEIDKILGLGQFDALGKKLQNVVKKAVEAGLLEGSADAREMLRPVYGKDTAAGRSSALKRLYAYSAKVEAQEQKRAQRELDAERRAENRRLKNVAKRQEQIDLAESDLLLYDPSSYTTATAAYAEATLARQNYGIIIRPTNKDLVAPERQRSAAIGNLIERSRANVEAANIRYALPFYHNRETLDAELGYTMSDAEWEQRVKEQRSGANAAQRAWLRGAAHSWERTEEARRASELKGMRSDAFAVWGAGAKEAADSLDSLNRAARMAGLALSAGAAFTTSYLQSVWQQKAARNITSSNMAYYQRWQTGGQVAGGLAGGLLGLLIGGPIGAVIGGLGLGSIGGLYGDYKQKQLEGVLKTVATTTAARRDFLTFRGSSGFALGQAMEDAGFGTAADLNNMRWTGQTLPGAMALGMVGEQDMLMLSLMPEYFAALMGGADAASLAQAYSTSVNRLPAQLQPLVSTMAPGGSQGMYANALDPQYAGLLRYGYNFALDDRAFVGASEYTTAGSIARARRNIGLARAGVGENLAQAMQGMHGDYFDMSYMSPMAGWATAMSLHGAHGAMAPDVAEKAFAAITSLLNTEHFVRGLDSLSRMAETGLNLVIRVEGLGDITQQFPLGSLADGQSVTFNVGGL